MTEEQEAKQREILEQALRGEEPWPGFWDELEIAELAICEV